MLADDILSKHLLVLHHALGHDVRFVSLVVHHGLHLGLGIASSHILVWIQMVKHVRAFHIPASLFIAGITRIVNLLDLVLLCCILRKLTSMAAHSAFLAISHDVLGQA